MNLINYRLQKQVGTLAYGGGMFDYVFAGNGTFVRGKRDGLDVQIKLADADVRGLSPAEEFFKFDFPKVPSNLVAEMLSQARHAKNDGGETTEILFYLVWDSAGEWQLITPEQYQNTTLCGPKNTTDPDYQRAVIEVHSHHSMKAFFSGQDDKDEMGFKLYAVWGEIFTNPRILVRCGLYGYFTSIPAGMVFDLYLPHDFSEIEEVVN